MPVSLRDASAALGARQMEDRRQGRDPVVARRNRHREHCSPSRASRARRPRSSSPRRSPRTSSAGIPSQALFTLPFAIFIYSESPDPNDHELAWAAALLLMMFVLVLSFLGRVFLARNRRKLEGGDVGSGSIVLGRYLGRLVEPMRSSRRDDSGRGVSSPRLSPIGHHRPPTAHIHSLRTRSTRLSRPSRRAGIPRLGARQSKQGEGELT